MENTELEVEVMEESEVNEAPASEADWENATSADHLSAALSDLAEIGRLCAISAAAYTNPRHNPSYAQIQLRCAELVDSYNWHSKAAALLTCAESDAPMLKAIELLEYPTTSVTEKKTKVGEESFIRYLAHKENFSRIKLTDVYGFCKNREVDCGSLDWYHTLEKLCCVMTLRAARDIDVPPEKIAAIDASFLMSKVAREVILHEENPDNPDPGSTTQVVHTIQTAMSQLLGDAYAARARGVKKADANFVWHLFAGQGRVSLSMKTKNSKALCDAFIQVAHAVMYDKPYTVIAATKKPRA